MCIFYYKNTIIFIVFVSFKKFLTCLELENIINEINNATERTNRLIETEVTTCVPEDKLFFKMQREGEKE
jgi:hypothetical protein